MRFQIILSALVSTSIHLRSQAFVVQHGQFRTGTKRISENHPSVAACQIILKSSLEAGSSVESVESSDAYSSSSPDQLIDEIKSLCVDGKLEDAMALLEPTEAEYCPDELCYTTIFQALAKSENPRAPELADELLERMTVNGCQPTSQSYNAVISVWAESPYRKEAADKCCNYLGATWSLYDDTNDSRYVPLRSSYISTITALSRSRQGRQGAERAEQLLEDMEEMRQHHPHLAPNTICVNGVLNAWSKSGMKRGAATRCEEILDRMINSKRAGQELQPDTTSFNTVLDTLAKSSEGDCERRAEELLETMQKLSSDDEELGPSCKPDQVSFNTVLNCWAQSRVRGAARRATSILQHMEQRYATNNTDIHPDTASYTTVINAWARSREDDAVSRAEEVLSWSEEANRNGNPDVRPNALTYNSMINCYSKSNLPDASRKAVDILSSMKEKSQEDGFADCHPDVVTYTSVIDTLSKQASVDASEHAELLLEELEAAYSESGDPRLKPNIRTYTSVINAIARGRSRPERAEAILNRIEDLYESGERSVRPDVVSFNALINAYGWSSEKGKAVKCFEILNKMLGLSGSGQNYDAKPDIITCNSVLNACAFEATKSETERAKIMEIVVQTLEIFQSEAPRYGYPDHSTYSQVLLAISKHMPMNDRRSEMAETTFWQCCKGGHVSAMVISSLRLALSWPRFSSVMGPALRSENGEKLKYDLSGLPREWTKHTPSSPGKKKWESRASRKRDGGFQITKNTLSKAKKASKKE